VVRRRPRTQNIEMLHNASYAYRVRCLQDGYLKDVQVCLNAFAAFHGISKNWVQNIRETLVFQGKSPVDRRGKHRNRKHVISEETITKACEFIASLKGRKSHYSLKKSKKLYLPEELNITKLFNMYTAKNPDNPVSYDKFRDIFNTKFNIGFGYPRKDTCSLCDTFKAEIDILEQKSEKLAQGEEKTKVIHDLKNKMTEKEVHLRKSEFYSLKKKYRKVASKEESE